MADVKADKASIPRRMRFYHSTIDVRNLQSGADYNQLKNVVIIMITPYDPFDSDRMMYTIRNTCIEDPEMEYDDGALSLFLYTKGTNGIISQELKQLLHYLEDTTWDNAVSDSLKEIQTMVDKVKYEETATVVYLGSFFREQTLKNEGRSEGKIEARAESIKDFLSDLGTIPENIVSRIDNERDTDTLSRWLKLAAKAGSIEEFTQGM